MINGYVNIPSELEPLGKFFIETTVPGIYKKMQAVMALNKPIVGHFSLSPAYSVDSIFFPIAYYVGKDIYIGFSSGNTNITIRINSDDQVFIPPVD